MSLSPPQKKKKKKKKKKKERKKEGKQIILRSFNFTEYVFLTKHRY